MPEKFHHPQVDKLREATEANPTVQARQLGRTWQRQLHRKVMRAIQAGTAGTVDDVQPRARG
jgi:hypothetical protein